MPPFLPIVALTRSQSLRIGTAKPTEVGPAATPTYVDLADGSARRDLQRHSAIGSYVVVGPLTASNSRFVIVSGALVTPGTGLKVNVSAGELLDRFTGAYRNTDSGTEVDLVDTTLAGQNQAAYILVEGADGDLTHSTGDPVLAPAPAVPGSIPAGWFAIALATWTNGASSPTLTDLRPRP